MAKYANKHFTKDRKITSKHITKCSNSLDIKEMQIKLTMNLK